MPRPRQRVCLQEGLKLDLNRLIRPRPQSNHLRRSRRRPPRAPVSFRQKSRRNLTVRPISSCGRISLPRFTTLPVIRVTGPRKQVPTCVRRRQRHRGSAPQRPRSARAHKRGCDEFDAKPIEFESLVATIRRACEPQIIFRPCCQPNRAARQMHAKDRALAGLARHCHITAHH
jgi:hypothetical protein